MKKHRPQPSKSIKYVIWLILFFITIAVFTFILLEESCTFHVEKLIERKVPPAPPLLPEKPSNPVPEEVSPDVQEDNLIEVSNQRIFLT